MGNTRFGPQTRRHFRKSPFQEDRFRHRDERTKTYPESRSGVHETKSTIGSDQGRTSHSQHHTDGPRRHPGEASHEPTRGTLGEGARVPGLHGLRRGNMAPDPSRGEAPTSGGKSTSQAKTLHPLPRHHRVAEPPLPQLFGQEQTMANPYMQSASGRDTTGMGGGYTEEHSGRPHANAARRWRD